MDRLLASEVLYPVELVRETHRSQLFRWIRGKHSQLHWVPRIYIFDFNPKRHTLRVAKYWRRKILHERKNLPPESS